MKSIKKIVVGADFSEATDPLVQATILMARACQASVDVVHVREIFAYPMPDGVIPAVPTPEQDKALTKWIDDSLSTFSGRLTEAGVTSISTSLEGVPARQIVQHAEKTRADLIIVGTHGR